MAIIGENTYKIIGHTAAGNPNVHASKFDITEDMSPGWVTSMGFIVSGFGTNIVGKGMIWDGAGPVLWQGPTQAWGQDFNWRIFSVPSMRVKNDNSYWIGFYTTNPFARAFGVNTDSDAPRGSILASSPPSNFTGYNSFQGALTTYFDYVPNLAPGIGNWVAPGANQTVAQTPTFQGTTPHAVGDSNYDHTDEVHIYVEEYFTATVVYDNTISTTPSEQASRQFSKSPVTLNGNTWYRAWFRHRDSWGVWSGWSEPRVFFAAQGPDKPSITTPAENAKLNQLNGFNYAGVYTHSVSRSSNFIEVEVLNETGTFTLFASGKVGYTVAPGQTWSFAAANVHPSGLAWGTKYKVRVRFWDSAGWVGPWSDLRSFKTNSFPAKPTNLSPRGDITTGSTILSCDFSDVDGDAITQAQIELVDAATGSAVSLSSTAMTVSGTRGSITVSPASMTYTKDYRWRARANDGIGWGEWSDYANFRYDAVPAVTVISPSSAPRINLVSNPSAEHEADLLDPYWTEQNRVEGVNYIERYDDGDAAEGVYSWRGVASATSTNRYLGKRHTVDPTKPLFAQISAKKEDDDTVASSHFEVLCYNSSDTLLGTLHPSSLSAAQGVDVPTSWSDYGGIVWQVGSSSSPAMPSGTTGVRLRFTPSVGSEAGGESVVRFDSAILEVIPLLTAIEWGAVQSWYGYADGDTEGYGPGGYAWLGTQGASQSTILPTLAANVASIKISYSHPLGRAKQDDRILVDYWNGVSFENVYDTGFVAGSGTLLAFPISAVRNEGRYQMRVQTRDVQSLLGEAPPVVFDVKYEGPSELSITVVTPDPAAGTITISYERSDLSSLDFAAIEVARESSDGTEPEIIIGVVYDPNQTSFIDHYPVSDREYIYKVRQIQNVGSDQAEGRWESARGTVSYPGVFFIKSVEDPARLSVAYKILQDSVPAESRGAPNNFSLFVRGRRDPVHYDDTARSRSGELPIYLNMGIGIVEGIESRWRKLEVIEEERPTVCLLSSIPAEKVFAQIVGDCSFSITTGIERQVSFPWERTSYAEDYYVREGYAFGRRVA